MSRYGFNVDDVEIVVGWDNPTQTFFGQTEVDGKPVAKRGRTPGITLNPRLKRMM